jgi:hypothetical protein
MPKKMLGKVGKVRILLVDGTKIRNQGNVNFAFAGNDKAYSFIPKNEVWIEKSVPKKDRKAILMHELAERDLMSHGMSYDRAHLLANQIEGFQRKLGGIA